ncbi:MAG: GNAT family N-acetyltransferase [Chloroflexi bacterium]|jgi:ribosomal protein S18 acetylase RimI-like enzyme|nr:GNAT family N-acetyltransferase [Chloroflexota bacterium]
MTDTSDAALITATRANLCDFFRHLAKSNHAGYFENERFIRWRTQIAHPWFHGILAKFPPKPGDDSFIEDSIANFRNHQAGLFTFWMDPPQTRADWESALKKFGFGYSDTTPGMAVELNALNESALIVDGLEFKIADDDKSAWVWAEVFTQGYGLPLGMEPSIFETWGSMGRNLPLRNYIGYLNGKPVATSCLFLGGGAAGIYSVATLPDYRGRGVGAAMTLKPLFDAQSMGYRIGVLQSSEMGFDNYKRLGFRHLCQIENFFLQIR